MPKETTVYDINPGNIHRFIKRKDLLVTAVQINLELDSIPAVIYYSKWGGTQTAKQGDWLLNNQGECYTVDQESFAATYEEVTPGQYCKTGSVWATIATADGVINTKEGQSTYEAGDYIVFNSEDLTDGYCMSSEKFLSMYERPNESVEGRSPEKFA